VDKTIAKLLSLDVMCCNSDINIQWETLVRYALKNSLSNIGIKRNWVSQLYNIFKEFGFTLKKGGADEIRTQKTIKVCGDGTIILNRITKREF